MDSLANAETIVEPEDERSRRHRLILAKACGILAMIFGGIVFALWLTLRIMTCYSVTVINESADELSSVILDGGGAWQEFGLAPHTQATKWLWFDRDGSLSCRIQSKKQNTEFSVEGYVTNSLGGRAIVRIQVDGTIVVENSHAPRTNPHVAKHFGGT